jgi:hypothetical protein
MLRTLFPRALGCAAATALCCASAAHAQAERQAPPPSGAQPQTAGTEVADYYDYYEVGYDTSYDDDWFFDYYRYEASAFEAQYHYYSDYDYRSERFDWEERGLFDGASGPGAERTEPRAEQPQRPMQAPAGQAGAKQAPDKALDETAADARRRTQTPRQVSGIVLGTKRVAVRGTAEQNLIVLIKTERGDRRLAIDLGPALALQEANVVPGSRVAAEGYVVVLRDTQFLAATRVKAGDETLDVTRAAQARLHRSRGAAAQPTPPQPPEAVPAPEPPSP